MGSSPVSVPGCRGAEGVLSTPLGLQETRQPGSATLTSRLLVVCKSVNLRTLSIFKEFPVFKERDALKCFPGRGPER